MVYVDDANIQKHGYSWFHLMGDSIEELHAFAVTLRLPARAFHRGARHPHYDVTDRQRLRALRQGARAISTRDAVLIARRLVESPPRTASDSPQLVLFA
ncbi:MAG: DUF4031 domain-containing protein [Vitreoscilla sp.]